MSETRAGARAFTLVEILISVVVLAVGILGVMALLPTASRAGAHVEHRQEISRQLPGIVAALRQGARSAQARYSDAGEGSAPSAVYFVFAHPDAFEGEEAVEAQPDAVFGSRACILLPVGSEKALLYPRGGTPEEISAKNGGGRVADAEAAPALSSLGLESIPTYAPTQREGEAFTSFALYVRRAQLAGRPRDGLYAVTLLFFLERPGGGPKSLLETFTTEIAAGPTLGAQAAELGAGAR